MTRKNNHNRRRVQQKITHKHVPWYEHRNVQSTMINDRFDFLTREFYPDMNNDVYYTGIYDYYEQKLYEDKCHVVNIWNDDGFVIDFPMQIGLDQRYYFIEDTRYDATEPKLFYLPSTKKDHDFLFTKLNAHLRIKDIILIVSKLIYHL